MKYLLLGLLLVAAPVSAQDRVSTSIFLGGAIADDVTTFHNMRGGFPEYDPLYHLTRAQPVGTLLSLAATDAVTLWLAHRYQASHPRLVRVVLFSLGGIRLGDAIHNTHGWNIYANRPIFIPSH